MSKYKLRNLLIVVLVFALLVGIFTPTSLVAYATDTYSDPELDRALQLGIGTYADANEAVTFAQFMAMLDRVVELADISKLTVWKAQLPQARASSETMKRADAMLCIFTAAEILGPKYFCSSSGDWDYLAQYAPWHTDEYQFSDFYGDAMRRPAGFEGDPDYGGNYAGTAYFYAFDRVSIFSNKTILDFDKVNNTAHANDPLYYSEALLAALRFYDSAMPAVVERIPTDEDAEILRLAEARKQAILDSPTAVTVSGKTYYVSNNGNDKNDGRSPQKPWKTIKKVNSARLKPGDGVFFNRGDIWRNEHLAAQKGVTYSAYGEGDKPKFYMSPENGTGAEKWTLVEGTDNIWLFYKTLRDCGTVVFNDGENCARKITPSYKDGKALIRFNEQLAFDIKTALEDDLDFYSELPPISKWGGWASPNKKGGALYLRCDKGNPGEIYDSIEFSTAGTASAWDDRHIITAAGDNVFDNLCLMYGSHHGLFIGSSSNVTTQNCEIAWIGGAVILYSSEKNDTFTGTAKPGMLYRAVLFGNGVEFNATGAGFNVLNNYIHHIWDSGASNQAEIDDGSPVQQETGMHYIGNLITHCRFGIELWMRKGYAASEGINITDGSFMKDIRIEDNYILYTGYVDNFHSYHDMSLDINNKVAFTTMANDVKIDGFTVKNNIFYLSKGSLIEMCCERSEVSFGGNTYAQNNWGEFYMNRRESFDYSYLNENIGSFVRDVLGDKTGTVLPLLK